MCSHLGSFLNAIESTVMCAFECSKVRHFVTHITETLYYTSDGFDDLPGCKIQPNRLQGKQQLHKNNLQSSSSPLLHRSVTNVAQIPSHSFKAEWITLFLPFSVLEWYLTMITYDETDKNHNQSNSSLAGGLRCHAVAAAKCGGAGAFTPHKL